MTEPKCEYCGCTNIESLVRCTKTGLYFCNGKGDTITSHIIHHLRTQHFDQITLPEQNPFYQVALKCYVCDSTNIFNLGFVYTKDCSQIFIVCRSKCQLDHSLLEKDVNSGTFTPIVSNGEILTDIVKVPDPPNYKRVPMSHIMAVEQAIQDKLNENSSNPPTKKRHDFLGSVKVEYESREQYVNTLLPFVKRSPCFLPS